MRRRPKLQLSYKLPGRRSISRKLQILIIVTPPKALHPVGAKNELVSRKPLSRNFSLQTPLKFRGNLVARKAINRAGAFRRPRIQGMRTHTLKLERNPTFHARVRATFSPPLPAFIHVSALGMPENTNPRNPNSAPNILRVFGTYRSQERILGEDTHRGQSRRVVQKGQAHLQFLIGHRNSGRARNRNLWGLISCATDFTLPQY